MIKKARVGLIIWGAILVVISIIFAGLGSSAADFFIIFGVLFVGGAIMIVFGILNVVKTSKYNNELLAKSGMFNGVCPSCRSQITASVKDFKPHGRYPEGFIYCPVCKKPISKNAFKEVKNGL